MSIPTSLPRPQSAPPRTSGALPGPHLPPGGLARLREDVLRAVSLADQEHDLASIQAILLRRPGDTTLLPVIGGLVSHGLLRKVSEPSPAGSGPIAMRRGRPRPVRFQLTDDGRAALRAAPARALPVARVPHVDAWAAEEDSERS